MIALLSFEALEDLPQTVPKLGLEHLPEVYGVWIKLVGVVVAEHLVQDHQPLLVQVVRVEYSRYVISSRCELYQ